MRKYDPLFIGVAGVSQVGKDLFCALVSRNLKPYNCYTFSLAYQLRKEINPFCNRQYGIDLFNCSKEEKELTRPILVYHAEIKRKRTKGRYFVEALNKSLSKKKFPPQSIIFISDHRFNQYSNDEFNWIRDEKGGIVVHIKKYQLDEKGKKKFWQPANEIEKQNDPLIDKNADYHVTWKDCLSSEYEVELRSHINGFRNFLINNNYIDNLW